MNVFKTLSVAVFIGTYASVAFSQSALKTQQYSKDGLSVEYVEGWTLKDNSTPLAQHWLLTRDGSSTVIMILAYRNLITSSAQLAEARKDVTASIVEDTKRTLGSIGVKITEARVKIADDLADGVTLEGSVKGEKTTADVYSWLAKLRFVNLAFIRADKDKERDDPAWSTVLRTLKLDSPLIGSKELGGQPLGFVDPPLNGHAISLPKPEYPIAARSMGISGMVVVRVIVGENGKVTDVVSVSGPPALAAAAATAARGARFAPLVILGQPVRVTGVITYNFVH